MSRREAIGMTAEPRGLRGELSAAATAYRHIREEHRRARPGGRTHRRLEARLEKVSTHFERLLADSPLEETERAEWRRHLHHGGPEPRLPSAEPPPHAAHRPPRNRARGSAPLWQR